MRITGRRKKDIFSIEFPSIPPPFGEKRRRRRSISKSDIRKLWERQKGRCARCGKKLNPHAYHVDHKRPLALGGSNSIRNLQLLCPECHMLKTQEDRKKISKKRRKKSKDIFDINELLGLKTKGRGKRRDFNLW